MKNKKLNNSGFSLVELIIVIAIMAILAAALAPQLIKYIEKSRVSTDTQACDTIKGCFNAAMNDEKAYKAVTNTGGTNSFDITFSSGSVVWPSSYTDLINEMKVSCADIAEPKASGMSKYTVSWDVDATTKNVSNVKVVTA